MKCPKCGYISFDYNHLCPKCNKDISVEQQKMNLPSFKPVSLPLLGALTGEIHEADSNLKIDLSAGEGAAVSDSEIVSLEDLEEVPAVESSYDEGPEIAFEADEEKLDEIEGLISFDDLSEQPEDTLAIVTEGAVSDFELELGEEEAPMEQEEISLDLEEISLEELEAEPVTPVEAGPELIDSELSLDLDEIQFDDTSETGEGVIEEKGEGEPQSEGIEIDFESLSLETEDRNTDEQRDEIVIGSDDLPQPISLDEVTVDGERTGDLQEREEDIGIDIDALILEDEKSSQVTDSEGGEDLIDLDDLDLDLEIEEPDQKSP
ncbi:MAG: hypothetical protein ABII26_02125 [Pseudomonadota bacterium]